jgi:hypothetical protein
MAGRQVDAAIGDPTRRSEGVTRRPWGDARSRGPRAGRKHRCGTGRLSSIGRTTPDSRIEGVSEGPPGGGRRLSFRGALNFRDLGGYPAAGGTAVRWGRVFRSDSLHYMTTDDVEHLDLLAVGVICDLRSIGEIADAPGPRPHVHVELPSRRVGDTDPSVLRDRADGERWLFEDYCGMLDDGAAVFARTFRELAGTGDRPGVFHCWGGKDRTGMTAAADHLGSTRLSMTRSASCVLSATG